jgi:hypothetical protein
MSSVPTLHRHDLSPAGIAQSVQVLKGNMTVDMMDQNSSLTNYMRR